MLALTRESAQIITVLTAGDGRARVCPRKYLYVCIYGCTLHAQAPPLASPLHGMVPEFRKLKDQNHVARFVASETRAPRKNYQH